MNLMEKASPDKSWGGKEKQRKGVGEGGGGGSGSGGGGEACWHFGRCQFEGCSLKRREGTENLCVS